MTPFRAALALLSSLLLATTAVADAPKADVAKSADHPVLKRFAGSVLAGYAQQDWEQRSFPDARGVSKTENDKFANPVSLEGKVTRLFYLARGKSPLEVYRNYPMRPRRERNTATMRDQSPSRLQRSFRRRAPPVPKTPATTGLAQGTRAPIFAGQCGSG